MPFRDELDAAKHRENSLAKELEEASRHADDLRAKQGQSHKRTDHEHESPSSRPKRRRIWSILTGWEVRVFSVVVVGVCVGLPAIANGLASSCGYKEPVIVAVEDCPEAVDALGDDIRFGYVGIACGRTHSNTSNYDYADWRVPIVGSRSSGVYRFETIDNGSGWVVNYGVVEVDGETIDLSQCRRSDESISEDRDPLMVLQEACDQDNGRACRDLSLLFEDGNTVEKDKERARQLAAKACSLGVKSACTTTPVKEEL